MYVIERVGENCRHMGIGGEWPIRRDGFYSLNIRNSRVDDLFDSVCWQALRSPVPFTRAPKSQAGVIYLVVYINVESVCSSIHPSQVCVSGVIHCYCRMQTVCIIESDPGIINNHQVAIA